MFPCIVSIIATDNQQDATTLIYSFLISSSCFGRCFRPSSGAYHCNYSFWYCPPMLLLAAPAVDNTRNCIFTFFKFLSLHSALCSLFNYTHQYMHTHTHTHTHTHIYIYILFKKSKIYIKTLKTLLHVSITRSSSVSIYCSLLKL